MEKQLDDSMCDTRIRERSVIDARARVHQDLNSNTKNIYICSLHFSPDCFMHIDGLDVQHRRKLIRTAVPTVRKVNDSHASGNQIRKVRRNVLDDTKQELNPLKTSVTCAEPVQFSNGRKHYYPERDIPSREIGSSSII
ncbi:uncharacterized protein LOC129769591 isoform X2 [Toxorhynchites rutilus septentrionalis]|uniref:uncharacterized protein LOC129769591 isoform X2 n=1 Tax=Toxorhynchites rutilus septentrionalis TaxID=329112 RepID=UPI00247A3E06|nr:uncharacterized protein LOC129769591 isoform X2 [Toxorhynchites rutilus septentrionalis]